jgi:phosphohistidine phosphatase
VSTRTLLLLRHGKAESPHGVADRDRPLARRGRRQSNFAGAECRRRGLIPDLAVVSPALRTRQTWDEFARGLGSTPPVDLDERIYANTVDGLLELAWETPDKAGTLLIVGHNPSVETFAAVLDDDSERRATTVLVDGYPTGVLSIFEVVGPWAHLTPGMARLREALREPR